MAFETKPKFATFDMNGTLIKFSIADPTQEVLGRPAAARARRCLPARHQAYRIDECMGDYWPFHQIIATSVNVSSTMRLAPRM